jgi:hypothetical protein
MPSADRIFGLTLALALAGTSRPARATLGEDGASVDRDREVLAMERQPARAQPGATVHELRGPTVAVREFLAPSGAVFAVAWSGIARPDLSQLLGAFLGEYRAASSRAVPLRGPRRVESGRMIVETWGHARSLHGRAWLPSLVPPEVSLDDVR